MPLPPFSTAQLRTRTIGTATLLLIALFHASGVRAVWYESTLPVEQKKLLEADEDHLDRVELSTESANALRGLLQISGEVDARALRVWLEERVKVIVPDFWRNETTAPFEYGIAYPHPSLIPLLEEPLLTARAPGPEGTARITPSPVTPPRTVRIGMNNLGASLYLQAKRARANRNVLIEGRDRTILSPRFGLIQVGSGLFESSLGRVLTPDAKRAGSLDRLMTLFHEARHSDGNGLSVTFPHALCPLGTSDYGGRLACDRATNGAYAVGAAVGKALLAACRDCGEKEKDFIRARILDDLSRVLKVAPMLDHPEKLRALEPEVRLCTPFTGKLTFDSPPGCLTLSSRLEKARTVSLRRTGEMDAAPETRQP